MTFMRYWRLIFLCSMLFSPPFGSHANELSGSIQVASDFFWRGYSKSNGQHSVQANIEFVQDNGLYVGVWAATVDFTDSDFEDSSKIEFAPYLGLTLPLTHNWVVDLQVTRYIYDAKLFARDSDYSEYYLFLHYQDLLTAEISFADDAYKIGKKSSNYQLIGRYPIGEHGEFSAGLGYFKAFELFDYDYTYWNFGYTWFLKNYVAVDARYFATREVNEATELNYFWTRALPFKENIIIFTFSVGL